MSKHARAVAYAESVRVLLGTPRASASRGVDRRLSVESGGGRASDELPPWRPGTAPSPVAPPVSRRDAMLAMATASAAAATAGGGTAGAGAGVRPRTAAASPAYRRRTSPSGVGDSPPAAAAGDSPAPRRTSGSSRRRSGSAAAAAAAAGGLASPGAAARGAWVSSWRKPEAVASPAAAPAASGARVSARSSGGASPAGGAAGRAGRAAAAAAAVPPPRASPAATLRFTRPRTAPTPPQRTSHTSGLGAGGAAGGDDDAPATLAPRAPLDEWGLPAAAPPSAAAAAAAAAAGATRAVVSAAAANAAGTPAAPLPGGTNTTLAVGYALGAVVGQGGFCKVRVGTHQLTGARVAVKVIDKKALTDANDRRRVGREVRVLKRLACGAVIRLFDVVTAPAHIFVVMEYADGGSLLDHVRAAGRLAEPAACRIFQQLLAGVAFCHAHGVIHRDVKLENALLDRDGNIKLIDFGLAALVPSLTTPLRVHCGSPSYAAPEIVARKPYLGPPVDVWSLGVVLFACAAGFLPFHAPPGAKTELSAKILKGQFTIPDGCALACVLVPIPFLLCITRAHSLPRSLSLFLRLRNQADCGSVRPAALHARG
jgi:5'-AMP-activated protein kinase catalytic alpha subunit